VHAVQPQVSVSCSLFALYLRGGEAAGAGRSIGFSYVMHRTGHHKVERLISVGHISGAALGEG
jgi:hypothetical protein